VVENLEMQRAPQPTLDGVYFITPSEDSVKRVVEDCKQSLYRKAHVFFTSAAPKAVLSLISSNRACVEKLNNCSELNMEYLSVDTKGFSLEIDDALRGTFALGQEASQAQARMMDMIARRLATVMVSLGEIPSVRHMAKIGNKRSDVSRGVAERLDRILTAMLRSKGAEAAKNNPTCDVLVVDRSFDIIAPIIHEWTYESMVTDLLDVPNGVYKYKIQTKNGEEAKEALLGESDPLWVELRTRAHCRSFDFFGGQDENVCKHWTIRSRKSGFNDWAVEKSGGSAAKGVGSARKTLRAHIHRRRD
jgi:syntaxin-binding protein 1